MVQQPEPGSDVMAKGGLWPLALACLVVVAMLAGCNRITLLRPDTSRGDFERTAPEVAIRDHPRRPDVYAQVVSGQQKLNAGDLPGAEQAARQAVKQDPRSAPAHTLLALVLEARGQAAQAGRAYEQALALAPAQGVALNNYGTWLCRNGRAADALAHFERAVADPGYATPDAALANLGACAHEIGDARADAALAEAIRLQPGNALALGVLAERSYRKGDMLRARAFSERRLAAAPATARVLRIASQIEDSLGDSRAAEAYRRRLRAEFPHDASQSDAMGHNGAR